MDKMMVVLTVGWKAVNWAALMAELMVDLMALKTVEMKVVT